MVTFSSEDMLQKYLISQSKLSNMIHKTKTPSLKNELGTNLENKKFNLIKKSLETSNEESGSEYFPSTESGKIKLTNHNKINNI